MYVLLFTSTLSLIAESMDTTFIGDIVFLMDSSSQISPREFFQEKYFVKTVSAILNVSPGKSEAAVISYANDVEILTKFEKKLTVAEYEGLIDNAVLKAGSGDIAKALKAAVQVAREGRYAYPKIAILIIAEKYDTKNFNEFHQALNGLGVKLYIIAISRNVDEKNFLPLMYHPDDIFPVDSFDFVQSAARPIGHKIHRSTGKKTC